MKTKIISIVFCAILLIPFISTIAAANQPPTAPDIEGKTSGTVGVEYTYGFCSSDPDGDNITICISWGDGTGDVCIGPFESGACVTATHTWTQQGTYTIKAQASDGIAESDWSTLEVTMPRSKIVQNLLIQRFFEQFPNAFQILIQLLKL
jgi:hypothetical protein